MLTLPWRRAEPLPVRYLTAEEAKAEEEREYAAHIEWERRIGEPRLKPLEWCDELPLRTGFYLIREPGQPRVWWKVVDVWKEREKLVAGWSDISTRPLTALDGWQFSKIGEPRP